jgi:hypothetical protein
MRLSIFVSFITVSIVGCSNSKVPEHTQAPNATSTFNKHVRAEVNSHVPPIEYRVGFTPSDLSSAVSFAVDTPLSVFIDPGARSSVEKPVIDAVSVKKVVQVSFSA